MISLPPLPAHYTTHVTHQRTGRLALAIRTPAGSFTGHGLTEREAYRKAYEQLQRHEADCRRLVLLAEELRAAEQVLDAERIAFLLVDGPCRDSVKRRKVPIRDRDAEYLLWPGWTEAHAPYLVALEAVEKAYWRHRHVALRLGVAE